MDSINTVYIMNIYSTVSCVAVFPPTCHLVRLEGLDPGSAHRNRDLKWGTCRELSTKLPTYQYTILIHNAPPKVSSRCVHLYAKFYLVAQLLILPSEARRCHQDTLPVEGRLRRVATLDPTYVSSLHFARSMLIG